MQISTVHKLQHTLDTNLKVLKFVWRHAFVLIVFGMMVTALVIGRISWENCFYLYVFAAFVDWCKTPSKSFSSSNSIASENMFEPARRSRDSSRFGSSAWATNPAMAGSPANSLYNLGYMTTNYN